MHIEWELRWRKKEIESENECKREMRKAKTARIRLFEKKLLTSNKKTKI